METNKVIIDNMEYDPYFILGVTFDDPIEHITKEFRRKAKVLHPDKLKGDDKKNKDLVQKRTKQFKILVDCYDFVFNQKQSFNFSKRNKNEQISINTHDINVEDFNNEFSRIKINNGGEQNIEAPQRNFEDFKREYTSSEIKPTKLFNRKKFSDRDRQEFNILFEYNKRDFENETQLVHKTTDGFNGYNTLDNCAPVSNYNGLLLVVDKVTSDFLVKGPRNPENKTIPKDFKRFQDTNKKLTKEETDAHIKMLRTNYTVNGNGSKSDYYSQEEQLLKRQEMELRKKSENDKKIILEHQHLFDEQTIHDALSDKLITSKDYTKFD